MNAKIYYTLDGSEPDESATEYTGPFTLAVGNHVVKARCYRNPQNYEPSATAVNVVVVQPEPVAPTFIQQPVNKVAYEGQQVTFGAEATGVPAPMYQWQRDGINLAGQTEPELTIAAARPGDAGTYRLLAWNSAGEVYSQEVTLTVNSSSDPGPGDPGDPGDPDYDYDMYMPLLIR